jgi:hypothetical protein
VSYDERLNDYVDVSARIAEFRAKYPEGSLQPADLAQPYRVETIGDRTYIVVVAAAYRSPGDERPGIGMAYEQWPGRTPYTKDSELQNAETSAWGRAIVAALASDAKKGIASAEEVRNRQADRQAERDQAEQRRQTILANARREIGAADSREGLDEIRSRIGRAVDHGVITEQDAVELRRLWVRRLDELFPQAQPALDETQETQP